MPLISRYLTREADAKIIRTDFFFASAFVSCSMAGAEMLKASALLMPLGSRGFRRDSLVVLKPTNITPSLAWPAAPWPFQPPTPR